MELNKKLTILLVEDDEEECTIMKNYISLRNEVRLVGIANSSKNALELIKTHVPDAIILDIELNDGAGSGLEILEEINKMPLKDKPIVIITTNILSKNVYAYAHENGADLIFHKLKSDYSPELIVKNILLLSKTVSKNKVGNLSNNSESANDFRTRLSNRINRELDLIGIGAHLAGRKYIHDAIIYILENKEEQENVFIHLARKYKKGNSTIGRSIQTAIEHAWRKSSIEDLQKYYTTSVNYTTGIPTPTEFIYYYVEKIKKDI